MDKVKYALLDTDFISKTYNIQHLEHDRLINHITKMPGYRFYCHKHIQNELNRHNKSSVSIWLQKQIEHGVIQCLTDEEIVQWLFNKLGQAGAAKYGEFLHNACESYSKEFFIDKFTHLNDIDYVSVTEDSFLKALEIDCNAIGNDNHLGELKSYVLLQYLMFKYGKKIYVFAQMIRKQEMDC